MTVDERIKRIMLLEEMKKQKDASYQLGLVDSSEFKIISTGPVDASSSPIYRTSGLR